MSTAKGSKRRSRRKGALKKAQPAGASHAPNRRAVPERSGLKAPEATRGQEQDREPDDPFEPNSPEDEILLDDALAELEKQSQQERFVPGGLDDYPWDRPWEEQSAPDCSLGAEELASAAAQQDAASVRHLAAVPALPTPSTPSGTLISHAGTRKITREELSLIPVPAGTRTHQPLAHHRIVEALVESLAFRHIAVVREEYAVSPDGARMFGVLDLSAEWNGVRFSIGLRNANDKSMRLGMTAGYRVTVCDNMMFKGDFAPVFHKHTRKLELLDVISVGVDKMQRGFAPLQAQIGSWQEAVLADDQARLLIYRAFLEERFPRAVMLEVHRHYFEPVHEEFRPRTLWSLSNAFTSAFKQLKPIRQFVATAKLGPYLETSLSPSRALVA